MTWEAWFEAFADAGPLVEQLYELSKERERPLSRDEKNACAFLLNLVGVANPLIHAGAWAYVRRQATREAHATADEVDRAAEEEEIEAVMTGAVVSPPACRRLRDRLARSLDREQRPGVRRSGSTSVDG